MSANIQTLADALRKRFAGVLANVNEHVGEITIEVPVGDLLEVCQTLRDAPEFAFEQLTDVCGVDYSEYGRSDWETSESATGAGFSRGVEYREYASAERESPRFAAVYHLLSYTHNRRLRLRVYADDEPPRVPSVVAIWSSANWFEREAFDLYGILFEGHPDLRRILSDYGFVGHPFRKDYPLIGKVEMRYDPEKKRVVYEPVSIEPRTLVPRVVRRDNRYADEASPREQDAEGAGDA